MARDTRQARSASEHIGEHRDYLFFTRLVKSFLGGMQTATLAASLLRRELRQKRGSKKAYRLLQHWPFHLRARPRSSADRKRVRPGDSAAGLRQRRPFDFTIDSWRDGRCIKLTSYPVEPGRKKAARGRYSRIVRWIRNKGGWMDLKASLRGGSVGGGLGLVPRISRTRRYARP